jgi:DNA-binding transcriptional regulator/RsmH inhibitor MraZ
MDGQGRIHIPPLLRETAKINGEVTVLANLDHLKVWNHAIFHKLRIAKKFPRQGYKVLEPFI